MRKTIVDHTPTAMASGPATVTTFAGANGLLTPIDEDFQGKPGRKTTQTESDG